MRHLKSALWLICEVALLPIVSAVYSALARTLLHPPVRIEGVIGRVVSQHFATMSISPSVLLVTRPLEKFQASVQLLQVSSPSTHGTRIGEL